jgi:V8-like Glu-specific endopeptidase
MKNPLLFFIFLVLMTGKIIAQEVQVQNPFEAPGTVTRGVFGTDDRKEATDATGFKDYVRATAVMVHKSNFYDNRIYGNTLRERLANIFGTKNFDPNVKFLDQPAIAQCTGFLIAPDILVTAGHCILDMNTAKDYYWVFDYTNEMQYNSKEKYLTVKPENIFSVIDVLAAEENNNSYLSNTDYAVLRLNKKSTRRPYRFRTSGSVSEETRVYTVGTPTGLPLKLSENSKVIDNEPETWFMSDTDVFPGNSGGPIFDPAGWIEGILVRTAAQTLSDGELTADYKYNADCDCIQTVEFTEVYNTAGSQAHKINKIPDWVLRQSIAENLYYAIEKNLENRFKDWEVYNWIFSDPKTIEKLRFEDLAISFQRYVMLDRILNYTTETYTDKSTREVMDYAYLRKDLKAFEIIMKHGVHVDAVKDNSTTFLQNMVIADEVSWVKKLLEFQPNLNLLDSSGNNLLHLAAVNGNMEMLQLLAALKINAGAKNRNKQLPEKIAKGAKNKEAANYLRNIRKGKIKISFHEEEN